MVRSVQPGPLSEVINHQLPAKNSQAVTLLAPPLPPASLKRSSPAIQQTPGLPHYLGRVCNCDFLLLSPVLYWESYV